MDLSNYWQENKRFLTSVGLGLLVFIVGWVVIDSYLGGDLRAERARLKRIEGELSKPMHSTADLELARTENQALEQTVATLRSAAEFAPREDFRLAKGVPAANRYFAVVSAVREDLQLRAGRAGLSIPPDLGLPALAPTREVEIARTLEALDAIERTTLLAIEAGVERLSEIKIKLDPRLVSGKGIHDLEKTMIELKLVGPAQPLTRLVLLLEETRASAGSALLVERADFSPERAKSAEIRLELVLVLPHLHGIDVAVKE